MTGLRNYDDEISRGADPYRMPCPECACDPDDAWGCDCGNPYCPCSEPEDENDDDG